MSDTESEILKAAINAGFKYIFRFFTGDVYLTKHEPVGAFGNYHFSPLEGDGDVKRVDIEYNNDPTLIKALFTEKYAVGEKIKHKYFGVGVINEINSCGSQVAIVKFESVGNKRLALDFAPVEKIA